MAIHKHYNNITDKERRFTDEVFAYAFQAAKKYGVALNGADPAEHAVEAFAKFIQDSKQSAKVFPRLGTIKTECADPTQAELDAAYWKHVAQLA